MVKLIESDLITVRSLKYDGSLHRTWEAKLISEADGLIALEAEFAADVDHPLLGFIRRGTISEEFFWYGAWYNVFRFTNPSGELNCYYCNVNLPIEYQGTTLSFCDLDLDVLWRPGSDPQVLDEEEFTANAIRYGYSAEIKDAAMRARDQIIEKIQGNMFPFSETPKPRQS